MHLLHTHTRQACAVAGDRANRQRVKAATSQSQIAAQGSSASQCAARAAAARQRRPSSIRRARSCVCSVSVHSMPPEAALSSGRRLENRCLMAASWRRYWWWCCCCCCLAMVMPLAGAHVGGCRPGGQRPCARLPHARPACGSCMPVRTHMQPINPCCHAARPLMWVAVPCRRTPRLHAAACTSSTVATAAQPGAPPAVAAVSATPCPSCAARSALAGATNGTASWPRRSAC